MRSMFIWFLLREHFPDLAKHEDRRQQKTVAWGVRGQDLGLSELELEEGKPGGRELQKAEAPKLFIESPQILGWLLSYVSGETPKKLGKITSRSLKELSSNFHSFSLQGKQYLEFECHDGGGELGELGKYHRHSIEIPEGQWPAQGILPNKANIKRDDL